LCGSIFERLHTVIREPPWDIRERTFEFSCDVVRFCRKLSKEPGCPQLAWQLHDFGTSVGANCEEARSAYSRREFAVKNCICLKEARESAFWLRVIIACQLTVDPEARRLLKEAGELIGIVTATVRSARRPQEP
jgi:four helix bundle protein